MPQHPRTSPSRRTYLRRRIVVFGGLVLLLTGGTYLPMTLLAPLEPAAAHSVSFVAPENPPVELAWPGYGASAIGAVGFPGVLATGGEKTPRSIASITKVITGLVVLDAKPLSAGEPGPAITMTAKDAALYHKYFAQNGKVEPVRAGLVLSQRQLMEAVLVSSANNYAESLAVWAYGSMPKFLDATRTWLTAHGLTNTTLLDSSGMNPGNTSTASDLVELGKIALANPTIAAIVSTKSVTLPYLGIIRNTNELLGSGGVDGIKTGTLPEAGACLLFAASVTVAGHEVKVVGVVLGGTDHPSLNGAVRSLLKSAASGFHELQLVKAGTVFSTYSTPWDQSAKAVATRNESMLVWAGTPITRSVAIDEIRTARAGDEVGSVTFTVADKKVTVPIALDAPLADPGPWWRLANPFGLTR
ncbi:MAG TPA: D-alanyl-D-alanine carboxypeptidase [Microbacteriaceae bacterium]